MGRKTRLVRKEDDKTTYFIIPSSISAVFQYRPNGGGRYKKFEKDIGPINGLFLPQIPNGLNF